MSGKELVTMSEIFQSTDIEVDTLKCPKCKAIWRARGHYNYDDGGYSYDYNDDICPNGCTNFFGFSVRGKVIDRN
jgi:hypothetical protein